VSADADPEVVVAMLDAGALGFVGKDEPIDQLLRAVHRSMEGRSSISVRSLEATTELLAEQVTKRDERRKKEATDRIARAIVSPSLHMVYQPIVELTSGTIVGVEALARFAEKPRRMPEAWFAEASRVGLLAELELAAVDRAITTLPEGHRVTSIIGRHRVAPQVGSQTATTASTLGPGT
jgi:hypothetical protein